MAQQLRDIRDIGDNNAMMPHRNTSNFCVSQICQLMRNLTKQNRMVQDFQHVFDHIDTDAPAHLI